MSVQTFSKEQLLADIWNQLHPNESPMKWMGKPDSFRDEDQEFCLLEHLSHNGPVKPDISKFLLDVKSRLLCERVAEVIHTVGEDEYTLVEAETEIDRLISENPVKLVPEELI